MQLDRADWPGDQFSGTKLRRMKCSDGRMSRIDYKVFVASVLILWPIGLIVGRLEIEFGIRALMASVPPPPPVQWME